MVNVTAPDYSDLPGRRSMARPYRRGDAAAAAQVDVSVLTPYYNTEDFFVETLIALQLQTLQNWEWIIVDDGSTDEASVERLQRAVAGDARIRVIRQANAGPGAARNTAYAHATGRYVCLLDSDDMFEPAYLEKCVWFLDSNPEFAFCNSYSVLFGDREFLLTWGFERGKLHLERNIGPPISVIRHAAYGDCGGFDASIRFGHEDWDFWLRMADAGHWGYTIPEFLQWYRKRGNGRFEEIMRSGNVNADFEARTHRKYSGLQTRFPEPVRRHPEPYESLDLQPLAHNPLAANTAGRRFLFLVPWMVTGGADRVNLDLIEGLVARGHDVTVCATLPADHNWEHEFNQFTQDVFVLPNILAPRDYPRFLNYLIASRGIDTVLVTASTMGYQLLPLLRAAAPQVAFIDMCHVEEPHWNNGGHPRFAVGYQDQLDLNIATTAHLADWMGARGAERARIDVMYTGIRTHKPGMQVRDRATVRAELGIGADVPVIAFAGRLCAQKRPELLARILGAVKQQGLPFAAIIVGDGELRGDFEAQLKAEQVNGQVHLLGAQPHVRWLEVLGAADILLMPSQYEGISIALLEAIAAGVVPVVAQVGGQGEIVTPEVGILVSQGEAELQTYAAALQRLIAQPDVRSQMAQACQALAASRLSWDHMLTQFLASVDRAHMLRQQQPRQRLSPGLARELATSALELKRLSDAVAWLWHQGSGQQAATLQAQAQSPEVQAVTRFAVALAQIRVVRVLIRMRGAKRVAKWLMARWSR